MIRTVLFDLDGTLSDSSPGIIHSIEHALATLNVACPPRERLMRLIGPPLQDGFAEIGLDEATVGRAMAAFRERYADVGLFENELHTGIAPLLDTLAAAGRTLGVATSKPTVFAERILHHFGIREQFATVAGAELDGTRRDKHAVIAHALDGLGQEADVRTVIVGDREHDVHGARQVGISCVGVTWGFGSRTELEIAGAAHTVDTVDELERVLLPHRPG